MCLTEWWLFTLCDTYKIDDKNKLLFILSEDIYVYNILLATENQLTLVFNKALTEKLNQRLQNETIKWSCHVFLCHFKIPLFSPLRNLSPLRKSKFIFDSWDEWLNLHIPFKPHPFLFFVKNMLITEKWKLLFDVQAV